MAARSAIIVGRPSLVEKAVFGFEAGTVAHGFDGEFDGAPGGHDNDGERGVDARELREDVEDFLAGSRVASVVEIHEEAIELTDLEGGDDGVGGGDAGLRGCRADRRRRGCGFDCASCGKYWGLRG